MKIKLLVIFFAFFFWGCAMSSAKNDTDKSSDETGPLGLAGEQYWNDPVSSALGVGEDRLFNEAEGMLIDAPKKVFIKERNSVPLICLRTIARYKLRKYSLETTTQLLAVHLETGNAVLVKLMRSPDIHDNSAVSRGYSNEWHVAELQSSSKPLEPPIMQIASHPGNNLLMLLCGPESSNQRVIEIIPDKESEKNGVYKTSIKKLRQSGPPPDISNGLLLQPNHQALLPPGEEKIWEVTAEKEGDDDYRVSIRYRVRGLPSFIYSEDARPLGAEKNRVFAALPVYAVICDENRTPFVFQKIILPVITPPTGDKDTPTLSGHTSFLLSKIASFQNKKFLYAWFLYMANMQLVKIELEKGWTDGLVSPPAPMPKMPIK
jgi:hypothetical protein